MNSQRINHVLLVIFQFFYFDILRQESNLFNFVCLFELFSKKFPYIFLDSLFFWDSFNEYWIIGKRGCSFIIIFFQLDDSVSDVEEGKKLEDKGYYSECLLLLTNCLLNSSQLYHESKTDFMDCGLRGSRLGQQAVGCVWVGRRMAKLTIACEGIFNGYGIVAADWKDEQDDAIFEEFIEERKAETQELQLFRVFPKGDRSLIDMLITTFTNEGVVIYFITNSVSILLRVWDPGDVR